MSLSVAAVVAASSRSVSLIRSSRRLFSSRASATFACEASAVRRNSCSLCFLMAASSSIRARSWRNLSNFSFFSFFSSSSALRLAAIFSWPSSLVFSAMMAAC